MPDNQEQLAALLAKLELLSKKQESFTQEVNALRKDLEVLQGEVPSTITETTPTIKEVPTPENPIIKEEKPVIKHAETVIEKEPIAPIEAPSKKFSAPIKKPKGKSNLEKFIGENLINKIGILITVIGVFIGAKYSIENNLISPLTRIILGYLVGLGLVAIGIKLKAKYQNYSAVLVSGALAILYFITFAAYSFYDLFPQSIAFTLMVFLTVFGVVAALNYNKQIIAHIGLVGAYAVPFLLSNNSGNAMVLFSYMAIINLGILFISIKKYWKALYYVAFAFTWLIFSGWIAFSYTSENHYQLALLFLFIFFLIFYATFLGYKLIKAEKFKASDVFMLLLNSFIFYGFGFGLLSFKESGQELLGVFTLANALVHFIVTTIIYKKKLGDKNLFYLAAGLVLVFITIAVPVQLDGNWVTLLWAMEAALLFWIGKSKNVRAYEYMSYPLVVIAFFSLTQDWALAYAGFTFNIDEEPLQPIRNATFLTSALFIVASGFINWINNNYRGGDGKRSFVSKVMSIAIPSIFILVLYCSFYLEIEYYFTQLYQNSRIPLTTDDAYEYSQYNENLSQLKIAWLLNYTLFFVSALAFVNIYKIKNRILGITTLVIALLTGFFFLSTGLYALSEMRENYLSGELAEFYTIGTFTIAVRYICIAFFGLLLFMVRKLTVAPFMRINFNIPFALLLHTAILWIASSELIHWMDMSGSDQSYKLGLSILWGSYSLLLIILGLWKKKKYLRISAIALFGITLIKLFFYDIASLNTISKTIVFVSLGILLLIISFLYNKYKHIITEENEN
ncbi:DUF2339 domain-containing protein [Maribacter sp. R77961]|uniref:DUF2339 domain-containing protein n=1 Tax=Maribacter sp. R77961 TaxID=3093871 RepID=UPI0037C5D352